VGCVAVLAGAVAVAMAIPQVRHWLGANAVPTHSSTATTAVNATSSRAVPKSTPSSVAMSAPPKVTNAARPETQAVTETATPSQAGAAASKSQPSPAGGAAAPSAPSVVGYVPAAMSKLYTAWEKACPVMSCVDNSTARKMHLTLNPWQGDVHELPNDGAAAFVATSDSLTLDPVPGYSGFPLLVEGVVPIVHLDGVNTADLVLDGSVLAGIYLGEITVWNDPRIVRLNPNLHLPATPTLPVFHHGSAPSNAVFSGYLARSDPTFRNQVGVGATNVWPIGTGRDTDGEVTEAVAGNNGSIGYVDYDFALQHGLPAAQLINAAGNPTPVSVPSIQAGANLACRDLHFEQQPSQEPNAWPMSAISFALIAFREPKAGSIPDSYKTTNFFLWVIRNGGPIASGLGYAPLPDSITQKLIARRLQLQPCF
jgi:phosphate transport system substrate-binding protein